MAGFCAWDRHTYDFDGQLVHVAGRGVWCRLKLFTKRPLNVIHFYRMMGLTWDDTNQLPLKNQLCFWNTL